MTHRRLAWLVSVVVASALALPVVVAGDDEPRRSDDGTAEKAGAAQPSPYGDAVGRKQDSDPKVYTNADLKPAARSSRSSAAKTEKTEPDMTKTGASPGAFCQLSSPFGLEFRSNALTFLRPS